MKTLTLLLAFFLASPCFAQDELPGKQVLLIEGGEASFTGLLMDEARAAFYADLLVERDDLRVKLPACEEVRDEQALALESYKKIEEDNEKLLKQKQALGILGATTTGAAVAMGVVLAVMLNGSK